MASGILCSLSPDLIRFLLSYAPFRSQVNFWKTLQTCENLRIFMRPPCIHLRTVFERSWDDCQNGTPKPLIINLTFPEFWQRVIIGPHKWYVSSNNLPLIHIYNNQNVRVRDANSRNVLSFSKIQLSASRTRTFSCRIYICLYSFSPVLLSSLSHL